MTNRQTRVTIIAVMLDHLSRSRGASISRIHLSISRTSRVFPDYQSSLATPTPAKKSSKSTSKWIRGQPTSRLRTVTSLNTAIRGLKQGRKTASMEGLSPLQVMGIMACTTPKPEEVYIRKRRARSFRTCRSRERTLFQISIGCLSLLTRLHKLSQRMRRIEAIGTPRRAGQLRVLMQILPSLKEISTYLASLPKSMCVA